MQENHVSRKYYVKHAGRPDKTEHMAFQEGGSAMSASILVSEKHHDSSHVLT